jgi:hypothetical protein
MKLREAVLVGWKDVVESDLGITDYALRRLVKAGALRRVKLKGMKCGKFLREDVVGLVARKGI